MQIQAGSFFPPTTAAAHTVDRGSIIAPCHLTIAAQLSMSAHAMSPALEAAILFHERRGTTGSQVAEADDAAAALVHFQEAAVAAAAAAAESLAPKQLAAGDLFYGVRLAMDELRSEVNWASVMCGTRFSITSALRLPGLSPLRDWLVTHRIWTKLDTVTVGSMTELLQHYFVVLQSDVGELQAALASRVGRPYWFFVAFLPNLFATLWRRRVTETCGSAELARVMIEQARTATDDALQFKAVPLLRRAWHDFGSYKAEGLTRHDLLVWLYSAANLGDRDVSVASLDDSLNLKALCEMECCALRRAPAWLT